MRCALQICPCRFLSQMWETYFANISCLRTTGCFSLRESELDNDSVVPVIGPTGKHHAKHDPQTAPLFYTIFFTTEFHRSVWIWLEEGLDGRDWFDFRTWHTGIHRRVRRRIFVSFKICVVEETFVYCVDQMRVAHPTPSQKRTLMCLLQKNVDASTCAK